MVWFVEGNMQNLHLNLRVKEGFGLAATRCEHSCNKLMLSGGVMRNKFSWVMSGQDPAKAELSIYQWSQSFKAHCADNPSVANVFISVVNGEPDAQIFVPERTFEEYVSIFKHGLVSGSIEYTMFLDFYGFPAIGKVGVPSEEQFLAGDPYFTTMSGLSFKQRADAHNNSLQARRP